MPPPRHRSHLSLFRFVLLLLVLVSSHVTLSLSALAQGAPAAPPSPTPEVILPDGDLKSPRATVATFLSSMDPAKDAKADIDRAIKTLDTSDLPELVRMEKARDLAVKLFAILTYRDLSSGKVPSSSSVDAIQILDVAGYGVYLERTGPNWRFSKTTVADIPSIFREIEPHLSKKELRALSDSVSTWLRLRTYVPESLKRTTFLIEDWQWLAGALALVFMVILYVIVVKTVHWFVTRFLLTRFTQARQGTLNSLGKPIFVVIFTIMLQLFLSTLDLAVEVYGPLVAWIATVRVAALVVLSIRVIELLGERLKQMAMASSSAADDLLFPLLQRILWLFAVALGIVQILTVHGVNVSGLIAGLGLGGLAFALAAKDTIENIFGSVAILIDRPFKVGEYVVVGGVGGTVERIGLRTTRLRTPDNSLVAMPNSKVIASHVENLGARAYLRTNFTLSFGYDAPASTVEALCAGIRELLHSHPLVKQDAIAVYLTSIAPNGLGVLVQFFLALKDWNDEQQRKEEIFYAILKLAERLGVRFAGGAQAIEITATPNRPKPPVPVRAPDEGVALAREIPLGWTRINR